MKLPLNTDKVTSLIPQKAPFVMVDELIASDDVSSIIGFTISEDNIFTQNGEFIEPGLIENIAQSGAIRAGYIFSKLKEIELSKPIIITGIITYKKRLLIFGD